jgi:hypothetical protein
VLKLLTFINILFFVSVIPHTVLYCIFIFVYFVLLVSEFIHWIWCALYVWFIFSLFKGQWYEIFGPRFFHQSTPYTVGPWLTGQNRFAYGFVFDEIITSKVVKSVSAGCWNTNLVDSLSRQIRSRMKNGFSLLIRALGGVDWCIKPRVENIVLLSY